VGAGADPCPGEMQLGRALRARACGGLGRREAMWRFGALGARRFGLRLWEGLCGLGRGAQCGGGSVGVNLNFYYFGRDGVSR
jgi:hypothetical protein